MGKNIWIYIRRNLQVRAKYIKQVGMGISQEILAPGTTYGPFY